MSIELVEKTELRLSLLLLSAAEILPTDALEILAKRWRLPNELKKALSTIITHISDISLNIPLARQKHLIRILGSEVFTSLLLLKTALNPQENYSAMMELAEHWQLPKMPISGKDLIALGIVEGKELGEKLHALEILWEVSDYTLTKEDLQNYLSAASGNDSSEGLSSSA
jgi:poly(A) polymerase